MQELKSVRSALTTIVETLDSKISRSEERLLLASRHHGILSLPTELLSVAFEMAAHRENAGKNANFELPFNKKQVDAFCRTCKHFRQVANSCSSFWTALQYCSTPEQIKCFKSRSKGTKLRVELSVNDVRDGTMEKLIDCVDDWATVIIDSTRTDQGWSLFTAYPILQLKYVENLMIKTEWWGGRNGGDVNKQRLNFMEGWSFPNLKRLWIPNSAENTALNALKSLQEVTYKCRSSADMPSLVTMFSEMRNLQILKIGLANTGNGTGRDWPAEFPQLPFLRELHIDDIDDQYFFGQFVKSFLKRMDLSRLETLHLSLRIQEERSEWWVSKLIEKKSFLSSVKHISLEFVNTEWPKTIAITPIPDGLCYFHNIETIEIAGFGVDLYLSCEDIDITLEDIMPNIRSFRVRQVSPARLGKSALLHYELNAFSVSRDSTKDKVASLFPEEFPLVFG